MNDQRLYWIFNDDKSDVVKNLVLGIISLTILFFIYNGFKEKPIENYKGSIVIEKDNKVGYIKVKDITEDEVKHKRFFVSEYDLNRYEVGDTIK